MFYIFLISFFIHNSSGSNPVCWFTNCEEKPKEVEKPKINIVSNPKCWFFECEENEKRLSNIFERFEGSDKKREEKEDLWLTDQQVINWSKDKLQKINCWFKECPPDEPKVELPKVDESFGAKLKRVLNAARPQKPIIENIFKSEWSPYCWLSECCNKDSIPSDTHRLRYMMNQYLYGQHLTETVIDAISAHWNSNIQPAKPLVLSFHGPVGVGKNYLVSLIAQNLYKLETKSKYVHFFTGRVTFTHDGDIDNHRRNLYEWMKSNVTQCPKQLFIFDAMDQMPTSIINDIKPMLDYREVVDGADYRQAIFIFIANIGSAVIYKEYEKIIESGKKRKDIVMEDFEDLIVDGAFKNEGALHNSDIIRSNLIDHYIPFLPLEEEHVIKCIKSAFSARNVGNPLQEHINWVLDSLSWNTSNFTRLSMSGCKRIESKVSLLVMKHYGKIDKKSEL